MVRGGARLDPDQAWGSFSKSPDDAPLQLAADDQLANGINAVDLEHRLRDIETDCRDRLYG